MSVDDKEKNVTRGTLIRRLILSFFPLVSIVFRNWVALGVTCGISVVAILLDRRRVERRSMPFLLFLLIVWLVQAFALSWIIRNSYDDSLPMEIPEVSMEKWEAMEANIKELAAKEVWQVEKYPWVEEFPPLGPEDPNPVIKTASVILVAHNEQKYIERTIDSIFKESEPDQLIEIIVIDDASDPPMKEVLDQMEPNPKVRLIRQDERQGLIRSKTNGANSAKGDLVIFLDAHVKPEEDWLLPLFRHTNENWKRVVAPVIPILNGETWTVDSTAVGYKMMFDWGLNFNWFDDDNDWIPILSGGLLAITRRYWHWSGEYDQGMLQWGGENIEQSIRIWLCGGEIVVARDSRVSHVFRPSFPYSIDHTQVNINKVRLVEVWFDQYKNFYYRADPHAIQLKDRMGDLTERLELQKKLHCKPFQYFVDRFRKVFDKRNMLPKDHFAIKDEVTNKCIEGSSDGSLKLQSCEFATGEDNRLTYRFVNSPPTKNHGGHVNTMASVRFNHLCFDANGSSATKDGINVILYGCQNGNKQQSGWEITEGGLRWEDNCVYADPATDVLKFGECTEIQGGFLGKRFYGHKAHRFVVFDARTVLSTEMDTGDSD